MESFSALLAFCAGNSPITGEFPAQLASNAELWYFLCSNGWANNRNAGDLGRHGAHHDVTATFQWDWICLNISYLYHSYYWISGIILIHWNVECNKQIHREFTGHGWIPRTKAVDAELWCFLWCAPEPTVEQTMETLVIWDAVPIILNHSLSSRIFPDRLKLRK